MEELIIVGSGCAGWTAAIYAARANLRPLVITGTEPGGLLTTTTLVENFPGFPDGIQGPQLMIAMEEQAKRFGARVLSMATVIRTRLSDGVKQVVLEDQVLEARAVILAVGARPRHLDAPGESELETRGVSYCATCDGALPAFRNQTMVVVGGGDSACEEALYLTRFASEVYLIHRRDQLRASPIMASRVLSDPKIRPVWNTVVTQVMGRDQGKLTGLSLRDLQTGKESTLSCAALFVAIGHQPSTECFQGQIDLDERGYIRVHDGSQTSQPGVFAAGDCVDFTYRQAVTAAGMGCMAALDAERYLSALSTASRA
ncbi:MAG: thioredoxin-disulfide reductase [Methylacidiphilaceae bacterium]|nr:thioredoxin-disulfide reductase [Candidatus Methylacidiphilaceae bacterium]